MTKKRTSLDAILTRSVEPEQPAAVPVADASRLSKPRQEHGNRARHQAADGLSAAIPVYEQLRRLAFEERAKMHDYLIEGLDLVFRKRGLPGIDELKGRGRISRVMACLAHGTMAERRSGLMPS